MINIRSTEFLHESFRKDEMVLGNEELQASTAYESFLTGETDILDLVKQWESEAKNAQRELKSNNKELIGGKFQFHDGC